MHSPTKNNHPKKTRKGTFSQATITPSEVGDFQGGYFVMPDPFASKENDYPVKSKNNHKLERSPARRKQHHTSDTSSLTSPIKERNHKLDQQDLKKPFVEIKKDNAEGEGLLTPGSFSASNTKSASVPVSPKQAQLQFYEYSLPQKGTISVPSSPMKDIMSTSPPASGRWAGPAFGNAPHPSTLPLPEWTHSELPPLSTSPPVQDGGPYLQYQVRTPASPTAPHYLPQSPPVPATPFSSIPVVPFPYVASHVSPVMPSSPASLDQLSTDLRRLLNINGGPIVNSDPILVSANSS